MFPDGPNLLEAYVWTKVNEINDEIQDLIKHQTKKHMRIKLIIISIAVIAVAALLVIVL